MEQIDILQQRLARAKAALRDAKRRQKEQEQQRIFDLVRRSGLSLGDLETLLANRQGAGGETKPVAIPAGGDFENEGQR